MVATKINSKVEASVWADFRGLADESHQKISRLLTEGIREYVERRRVRPVLRRSPRRTAGRRRTCRPKRRAPRDLSSEC